MATISAISGIDFPDDARGIAITDWDQDGDQDIWISNRNAPRLRFMRNDVATTNAFIAIKLKGNGKTTSRDAIGSRVVVHASADGKKLSPIHLTLRAGEGFISQSSKWLHFGLGSATTVDSVVVRWAGGDKHEFKELVPNERYVFRQEGQQTERVQRATNRIDNSVRPQDTPIALPPQTRSARVVLASRLPMPRLTYTDVHEQVVRKAFGAGKPVLINLWASWCQPCIFELRDIAERSKQLNAAGLEVLSLSVDRVGESGTDNAEMAIAKTGNEFPWGYLDARQMTKLQELVNQFSFLRRTLPLPSSLLVDQSGRAAVLYRGPVPVEQVIADLNRIDDSNRAPSDLVACLSGHSIQHPRIAAIENSTDRQTRYRTASWLEAEGYLNDAVDHFSILANDNPSWGIPQQHLAKLYLDENQLEYAEAWAAAALRANPEGAQAHNTVGLIRSRQGKPKEAERSFRLAIKTDRKFAGAYNNLGIALAMQKNLMDAEKCFQRAISIDTDFAEAHLNLGNTYASREAVEPAISHYSRAIEINSQYVDPHNNLATLYMRLGKLKLAIESYQEALKIEPGNAESQRGMTRAMEQRKKMNP